VTAEATDDKIVLGGELRIGDAAAVWDKLRAIRPAEKARSLEIDLTNVAFIDGAIMSLLVDLRARLAECGIRAEIVGASERVKPLVHLYRGDEPPPSKRVVRPRRDNFVERIGRLTERAGLSLGHAVAFLGDMTAAVAGVAKKPRAFGWRSIGFLTERAGMDGIPIVLLLNFLVGFVMAYQSSRQLQLYGANIYVADVVGISVTRELAPLMTAIIMSGRSAASFAAELGTMSVSQEIDALRTMGFSPIPYLTLPRVLALAVAAPVLTLLGDVVGVVGGMVVAGTSLDVSPWGYVAELRSAVFAGDVWTGLVKSVAFATAIAFIGCQQGLATRGSAEGVGRSTTTTVVLSLFAIVVIDTLFTVLFRALGQ
jgi:phospholipid/cholesterol/gamma-HCH transport system permease protein